GHPTAAHVHASTVAIVNLERWRATYVHQWRLELSAVGTSKESRLVNASDPPVNISRGAAHPVRALVPPVAALECCRPHLRRNEQLALGEIFPRLACRNLDDRREQLVVVVRVAIMSSGRILEALREDRRHRTIASHDS